MAYRAPAAPSAFVVTLLAAASGVFLVAQSSAPEQLPRIAVRAATLIDGGGGTPVRNAVVLIEGERITAVGANLPIPSGVETVDLGNATLLPGLIDAHTHIAGGDPSDYYEHLFRHSPIDDAVEAHV